MYLNRASAFVTMLTGMVSIMFAVLPADAVHAEDQRAPARHLHVVNATFDSVIALAFAPADGSAFRDIDFQAPLLGGLNSITVTVPEGGCLRDVRVTFHTGRTLVYPNLDVCRHDGLRLTAGATSSGPFTRVMAEL